MLREGKCTTYSSPSLSDFSLRHVGLSSSRFDGTLGYLQLIRSLQWKAFIKTTV